MQYKQINVNSVLNKIAIKDRLFIGDYTVDPYQNCEFGCLYCDSSFDKTIYIKSNSAEILRNQLKNQEKGRIIVGSVHDPYQRIEMDFKLTRKILETIAESGFSCHILTKSDLVLRDLEILSEIDDCIVTMSIASLKDSVSDIFESNVPKPVKRLDVMEKLNNNGIKSGLAVIPIFPFISEVELDEIFRTAKASKADYILYKHLELKGDQKNIFFKLINKYYPDLLKKYEKLYENSYMPNKKYLLMLDAKLSDLYKKYKLKNMIF